MGAVGSASSYVSGLFGWGKKKDEGAQQAAADNEEEERKVDDGESDVKDASTDDKS